MLPILAPSTLLSFALSLLVKLMSLLMPPKFPNSLPGDMNLGQGTATWPIQGRGRDPATDATVDFLPTRTRNKGTESWCIFF